MDREYRNVLNYTEEQMITLCSSSDHLVGMKNDYSYIKDNGSILVNFTYSECLMSNYIAYQNPNYSNKWFFAWIDKVEYNSDSATRLFFTIDIWSTWFSKLDISACYVIREHVNDDTIGKHTVPENLEHGEYIINSMEYDPYNVSDPNDANQRYYIVSSNLDLENIPDSYNDPIPTKAGGIYSGVYSGNAYYATKAAVGPGQVINEVTSHGQGDAINGLFVAPEWVVGMLQEEGRNAGFVYPSIAPQVKDVDISRNTSIGSSILGHYTPKNNKLFTEEYNYLLVNNGAGGVAKYNWEDFQGGQAHFKMKGVLCPGCSIKLIPNNYQDDVLSDNNSLVLGKYPQLNWSIDGYLNWMSQTAVNTAWEVGFTAVRDAVGLLTGSGGIGSSVNLYMDNMKAIRSHSYDAPQNRGNVNSGDLSYSAGLNRFQFYRMNIKPEYARQIDSFFSRFGYKINEIKVPNITGRRYWNFIQIGPADDIAFGSIPTNYLEKINSIARDGVTIWHDHSNLGNYSLDNVIV